MQFSMLQFWQKMLLERENMLFFKRFILPIMLKIWPFTYSACYKTSSQPSSCSHSPPTCLTFSLTLPTCTCWSCAPHQLWLQGKTWARLPPRLSFQQELNYFPLAEPWRWIAGPGFRSSTAFSFTCRVLPRSPGMDSRLRCSFSIISSAETRRRPFSSNFLIVAGRKLRWAWMKKSWLGIFGLLSRSLLFQMLLASDGSIFSNTCFTSSRCLAYQSAASTHEPQRVMQGSGGRDKLGQHSFQIPVRCGDFRKTFLIELIRSLRSSLLSLTSSQSLWMAWARHVTERRPG